jgi:hypothetical protein
MSESELKHLVKCRKCGAYHKIENPDENYICGSCLWKCQSCNQLRSELAEAKKQIEADKEYIGRLVKYLESKGHDVRNATCQYCPVDCTDSDCLTANDNYLDQLGEKDKEIAVLETRSRKLALHLLKYDKSKDWEVVYNQQAQSEIEGEKK